MRPNDRTPLSHQVQRLDGPSFTLELYRGLPLLIVNTASEGPFADQSGALQVLYQRFAPLGLEVLAFPSDSFGNEPREGRALVRTMKRRYGVEYPVCEKVEVEGEGIHPLWGALLACGPVRTQGPVRHDFTKFLVDPDGYVVERLGPEVGPLDPRLAEVILDSLPTTTRDG